MKKDLLRNYTHGDLIYGITPKRSKYIEQHAHASRKNIVGGELNPSYPLYVDILWHEYESLQLARGRRAPAIGPNGPRADVLVERNLGNISQAPGLADKKRALRKTKSGNEYNRQAIQESLLFAQNSSTYDRFFTNRGKRDVQHLLTHPRSNDDTRANTRASKMGIIHAHHHQQQIHFVLDGLDTDAIAKKEGEYSHSITSKELRFIYRHWKDLQGTVKFYHGGKQVDAPWLSAHNKPKKSFKDYFKRAEKTKPSAWQVYNAGRQIRGRRSYQRGTLP